MKRHLIVGLMALFLVLPALAQSPDYHGMYDGPVYMAADQQGTMWAVWAYRNGGEFDIAVSQMIGQTWTFPELLGQRNGRDDLDPRLSFTPAGLPLLVWWQDETEKSTSTSVYSFLTANGWKTPIPIDGSGLPNSNPSLVSTANDSFVYTMLDVDGNAVLGSIKIIPTKKPRPKTNGGSNGPDPMPTIVQRRPPTP